MIYISLLITGIVLLIISAIVFKNNLDLIKNGNKTTAIVIDLERDLASDSNGFTPIFKFTTNTGEIVTFKGFGASSPPAFKTGEEVNIVYNPNKPSNAKVLTYFGTFGLTILLVAVSIPMIVIGGGYFMVQQFFT